MIIGCRISVIHHGQVCANRLPNRCNLRFQSNYQRGYFCQNTRARMMSTRLSARSG